MINQFGYHQEPEAWIEPYKIPHLSQTKIPAGDHQYLMERSSPRILTSTILSVMTREQFCYESTTRAKETVADRGRATQKMHARHECTRQRKNQTLNGNRCKARDAYVHHPDRTQTKLIFSHHSFHDSISMTERERERERGQASSI